MYRWGLLAAAIAILCMGSWHVVQSLRGHTNGADDSSGSELMPEQFEKDSDSSRSRGGVSPVGVGYNLAAGWGVTVDSGKENVGVAVGGYLNKVVEDDAFVAGGDHHKGLIYEEVLVDGSLVRMNGTWDNVEDSIHTPADGDNPGGVAISQGDPFGALAELNAAPAKAGTTKCDFARSTIESQSYKDFNSMATHDLISHPSGLAFDGILVSDTNLQSFLKGKMKGSDTQIAEIIAKQGHHWQNKDKYRDGMLDSNDFQYLMSGYYSVSSYPALNERWVTPYFQTEGYSALSKYQKNEVDPTCTQNSHCNVVWGPTPVDANFFHILQFFEKDASEVLQKNIRVLKETVEESGQQPGYCVKSGGDQCCKPLITGNSGSIKNRCLSKKDGVDKIDKDNGREGIMKQTWTEYRCPRICSWFKEMLMTGILDTTQLEKNKQSCASQINE